MRVTDLFRLGEDAKVKEFEKGSLVTVNAVCNSQRFVKGNWEQESLWVELVMWNKEKLATHLTKGKSVYVSGLLYEEQYEDKVNKKINVQDIKLS